MPSPLIAADNSFALLAIAFVVIAIGVWSERTSIGKRVSGAVIIIVLAAVLANIGVMPNSAPVFSFIWIYLVPLAVALYLTKANLIEIVTKGGRVVVGFAIGAVGAVLGSLLGPLVLNLGDNGAEYAAIFGATFTGGSLNFAAVAESINFNDPATLAAAVAIDNVLGVSYFILLGSAAVSPWLMRYLPQNEVLGPLDVSTSQSDQPVTTMDVSVAMAIAAGACAIGQVLANISGLGDYSILFTTALMIMAATLFSIRLGSLQSPELIATIFMYLFFVLLGAGADVSAMVSSAPSIFFFVSLIFAVHLVIMLIGCKLFRIGYDEAIIASSACIGGPPIAIAFAILFDWKHLATPGIVAGILGYAVGNFIGIGIFVALGGG